MRVLIVGNGGREHAIAWAFRQSPETTDIVVAPGNPGTAEIATNLAIRVDDIAGLVEAARLHKSDLVVIGPEVPLVLGLADRLREDGRLVVGPSADAARLEGSKAFAKAFMHRHGIPTASYRIFSSGELDTATGFIREQGAPIVVKASGLAAGKGAIVCESVDDAIEALTSIMEHGAFGDSGDFVVVESFMRGEEASIFALCDGSDYVVLAPAQDHKRIGEDDTGPNTGGMGAYCPAPVVSDELMQLVRTGVIDPTLAGMAAEGSPYSGFLYVGIMVTDEGPKVVEYNCRLGDPEAQVVLPMLGDQTARLFMAAADGTLADHEDPPVHGAAACVVLASSGYPGPYQKGIAIEGLPSDSVDGLVFQAGTRRSDGGGLETAGGRVLTVAARGDSLEEALKKAYTDVSKIHFEGMQFRTDIGRKGLRRLG